MKIYIKAMSEDLQKVRDKLSDASDQINMHLLKILLYPDSSAVNHWKGEIYSFLHKVDRIKGKNKWPKSAKIKEWLSTHNDMIEQFVILVEDEESDFSPRNVPINVLEDCIEEYYNWIAIELSTNGVVRKTDIYNKIDDLLDSTL